VLSVEPAPALEARRRSPLGPEDFLVFNQQLGHLTAAGLPVERGLRLIAADMHSGRLASAARSVADELERGVPLSTAFDKHASRFPPLYGRLIDAGVQAGNLPGMLFNLGHHLELVSQLRKALWRTLAYPLMVLSAMSLVLLFISLVILPKFRDMCADFRTTLPSATEFILWFGQILPYLLLGFLGVILLAFLVAIMLRVMGKAGTLADHVLIRLPVIGPVLRWTLVARWIDALRIGIDAGLDLPRAAALASSSTASPRLEREGEQMAALLVSGRPFHQFEGKLIPQTIPASIELASRGGGGGSASGAAVEGSGEPGEKRDLSSILATLTRMYQEQAEHPHGPGHRDAAGADRHRHDGRHDDHRPLPAAGETGVVRFRRGGRVSHDQRHSAPFGSPAAPGQGVEPLDRAARRADEVVYSRGRLPGDPCGVHRVDRDATVDRGDPGLRVPAGLLDQPRAADP
jgi:type IV pilus assembly protein PilC